MIHSSVTYVFRHWEMAFCLVFVFFSPRQRSEGWNILYGRRKKTTNIRSEFQSTDLGSPLWSLLIGDEASTKEHAATGSFNLAVYAMPIWLLKEVGPPTLPLSGCEDPSTFAWLGLNRRVLGRSHSVALQHQFGSSIFTPFSGLEKRRRYLHADTHKDGEKRRNSSLSFYSLSTWKSFVLTRYFCTVLWWTDATLCKVIADHAWAKQTGVFFSFLEQMGWGKDRGMGS